jgi:lipooligosaccharide transport system permease protein
MSTPGALRIVEWNLLVFKRLWRASLLSSFLQPLLYLLAMGVGVGALVNRNTTSSPVLHGLSYIAFVAPGLLATTAMGVCTNDSMWPILDGFHWGRQFEAMAATPLSARDIVTAHAIWLAVRCTIAAVTVGAAMELFPAVRSWGLLAAIPAAVLGGLGFGLPIAAWSSTRKSDQSFPVIQRFVITPLFLFGGAFFPVTQMPVAVRWVAYVSPLWHSVELCRGWATMATISAGTAMGHVCYLIACAGVGGMLMSKYTKRRLFA